MRESPGRRPAPRRAARPYAPAPPADLRRRRRRAISVEGSVALDAHPARAFRLVSDHALFPRLYPSTTSIRVLSQEQRPAPGGGGGGHVLVTTCEQARAPLRCRPLPHTHAHTPSRPTRPHAAATPPPPQEQCISFLRYFSGTFTSTFTSEVDAAARTISYRVLGSTLMESGAVTISVAPCGAGEAAGGQQQQQQQQQPEGQEEEDDEVDEGAGADAAPAGPGQGQEQGQGGAPPPPRCRVTYGAVMRMRVLPPLQSWRHKVYQCQSDEVAAFLANVAAALAGGC